MTKRREVLGRCPVCGDELKVTALSCRGCQSTLQGSFELCKFCKLTEEQKSFALIFIKNRGNIKEIEKEMGISYPTVRNKLDDVVEALGYSSEKRVVPDKTDILKQLSEGTISKEEALKRLSGD
jgi:hypothetical protein